MMATSRVAACLSFYCVVTTSAVGQLADGARAYSAEAIADAAGRTSGLAAPDAAPVKVFGYAQFRYNFNLRDQVPGGDDATNGFQTARTKLGAAGNVNDDLGFFVLGSFGVGSGTFTLHDAYGTWKLADGWSLKWGQYKLPLMREETISDTKLLAADRSVMHSVFTQGRSQGVEAAYTTDQFRLMADFSDGLRTLNTDFNDGEGVFGGGLEADYALTARVEYKWAGDWDRFNDFTSWQGAAPAGMAGLAVHYQGGGNTVGTFDVDLLQVTADATLKGDGWNAFAAGVYRHLDPSLSGSYDDFGWLIQGGYFLAPDWELFARWDQVFPDSNWIDAKTFSELTIGVNHYCIPESHAAKFTLDVTYFPTDQAGSSGLVNPGTLTGLLGSDQDGQWNLRAQFQIMF
jgi:hypothetical protein